MKKIRGLSKQGKRKLIPYAGPLPRDIQIPGVHSDPFRIDEIKVGNRSQLTEPLVEEAIKAVVLMDLPPTPITLPRPETSTAIVLVPSTIRPPPPTEPVPPVQIPKGLREMFASAKKSKTRPISNKALAEGFIGAVVGDAADRAMGTDGIASLLLGGIGKVAAIVLKDTNPEAAATLDAAANGALVGGAVKAASKIKPEPLVEEAKKAVALMDAEEKEREGKQ